MPGKRNQPPTGTARVPAEAGDPSRQWLERRAREDKLFMTDDEQALWTILKGMPPSCRFVRQHIIGPYIADFACPARRLIVELAGKYHFRGERPVADSQRRADLNAMGYTVATVTADEVATAPRRVARQIEDIIHHMEISYPNPSPSTAATPGRPTQQPALQHAAQTAPSAGAPGQTPAAKPLRLPPEVTANAWAVDAACSGNPGPMEYQGIDLTTGQQVFHYGPVHGTNNIGEFLAIVHALALWDKQGVTDKTLYSDSYNAILWVKKKQCRTKLVRNAQTEQLHHVIERAEQWLRTHTVSVPIVQWDTRRWGDIPADFGRK